MKRTLLAVLALLAAPLTAVAGEKVIYGDDDRKDYFEAPAEKRALADSVVSLWDSSKVFPAGAGFGLSVKPFGGKIFDRDGGKLCASEPFRDQPIGAECSGTLVGEDLVMTAGHCINSQHDCDAMKVVFDFNVKARGGRAPSLVPASAVYSCKSVVAAKFDPAAPAEAGGAARSVDYAIIRLDRKAAGRKPLPIDRGESPRAGAPLFTIGHPVGLPVKIADNATVLNTRPGDTYYEANLDTYGGNSGSGVFSAETGLLVGILVRGRADFVKTPEGCYVSNVLDREPKDTGEAVTRIALVAGSIPQLPPRAAARAVGVDSGPIKTEPPAGATWESLTGR